MNFQFMLGEMTVVFDSIPLLNYGNSIKEKDGDQKIIIGTLGMDLLEKAKVLINFTDSKVSFFTSPPDSLKDIPKTAFKFKERRVLMEANIAGESKTLMWDTGASAYNLITSKGNFHRWRNSNEPVDKHESNQLTRKISVYTAPTALKIDIAGNDLKVGTVTYVEGFPWYVKAMFLLSGMEGMVGNNLFIKNTIYLDCEQEQMKIY